MVMTEGVMMQTTVTAQGTMTTTLLISVTVVGEKGMDVGILVLEILADTLVEAGILMNPATINMAEAVEKRRPVDTDAKAMAIVTCLKRIAETSIQTGSVVTTNRTGKSEHWSRHQTGVTISSLHFRSVVLLDLSIKKDSISN